MNLGGGLKLGGGLATQQAGNLQLTGLGGVQGGLKLGQSSGLGLGQSGGLTNQSGGLGLGQTSGLGLGQTSGLGLGQTSGLGLGQTSGLGLGQTSGLGLGQTSGLGLGQTSGLGLGQTSGLGLGQTSGLGLGQTSGLGLGQTGGLGLGQTSGLGLGQTSGLGQTGGLGQIGGLGLGRGSGGTGLSLGTSGLSLGGSLGSGLGGTGTGGGGLNLNKGLLGGLNLAGTQTSLSQPSSLGQGIFNTSNLQLQQQQQQQLSQQQDDKIKFQLTIKAPGVFGDDKDQILVKFNVLQACCGTGKGLVNYYGQLQFVNFTPDNPLCRFKTICYNRIPTLKNEDGLVSLKFVTAVEELLAKQEEVCRKIQDIVGNSSVQVVVESVGALPDNCSEMTVFVLDKNTARRLLTSDVHLYLQSKKAQLEKLGVAYLCPKEGLTEESLKSYLQTPPLGINSHLWEQSIRENPDPTKFVPVPIVGSAALLKRMKQQEQESKKQQTRLQTLTDAIVQLRNTHSVTIAKIAEHKRKQVELGHRVLKVMVEQEVLRKSGYSVQPEEEHLKSRLEAIQAELAAPLKFKGRLYELMSQLRMQTQVPGIRADMQQRLDPSVMSDIKRHLEQQQGALGQLVKVVREVTEDLHCMEAGFTPS